MNFIITFSTCKELITLKIRGTLFVLISFLRIVELDHLVPECRVQTTHSNSQFPLENYLQENRSRIEILRKNSIQLKLTNNENINS